MTHLKTARSVTLANFQAYQGHLHVFRVPQGLSVRELGQACAQAAYRAPLTPQLAALLNMTVSCVRGENTAIQLEQLTAWFVRQVNQHPR